jgi:hypothetical protein
MLSKTTIFSALAGLALLALPVSAIAGHDHDRDDLRPQRWHDRGWHRGWEHQARSDEWHGGWYGGPQQRFDQWNDRRADGCDEDGDDCDGQEGGTGANYGYYPGAWNGALPGYSGSRAGQSLPWLLAKRQQTMVTIANLRARHDSRGAARLVPTVKALNRRIATVNRYGSNGYRYSPGSYVAPPTLGTPYSPVTYGGSPYAGNYPNYGNYNYANSGYYGAPYTGNPTVDALTSIAVPLLTGVR